MLDGTRRSPPLSKWLQTLTFGPVWLLLPTPDQRQETDTPVTMQDVRAEIGSLRKEYNMGQLRMKSVRRKYPFDKEGVPRGESDFLKVICSSSVHLPANLSGMVAPFTLALAEE